MKVAIITVNYNRKKDTLEFLESLKKLRTTNYQLLTIVVDNGSTDGSVGVIQAQYPDVVILQNGENKGFAGGYNRGMDYAYIWGADYFLIINNDAIIKDTNLLDELIKTAQLNKRIGLVSPKIYFAKGFEFHKERYKSADLGHVIWYGGGTFDWDNIQAKHRGIDEVDRGKYNNVGEVGFVSGACLLIKREVLEKVGPPAPVPSGTGPAGGFDEKLFAYLEDVDFLKRAKDAGFKAFYNGKVAIYHKVSQTAGIGSPLTDYYHARNRLIIGFKYGKLRTKFALWREAVKLLIFGRPAQKKGVWDFLMGKRGGVNLNHLRGEYPFKLSICIVTYNTADLTKKLLQSIFNPGVGSYLTPGVKHVRTSGFDPDTMEVIVLDNGSKDNCREVIKEYLHKIQYLQNETNTGFSRGYNKTIKYSKGEYILLLNSDIEVLKGSLSEIVKWADQYNGKAVLGGRLVFPDGSKQDSAYHLPTIWGAFKEYFLAKRGSYFMFEPKGEKPTQVEGLVMACFLIPKKILNLVGFLDEGTFIFFEDIEYARRLKKFGVPIYFVPSAKFIHYHGAATKRIGEKKAFELLQKSAQHYHGKIYYRLLTLVLWLGQKLGRIKTPVSRWVNN